MSTADTANHTTLVIRRQLAASPEKVFEAWTKAEHLAQWMAPTAEMTTTVHELDLRVGGRYRIEMRDPTRDEPYIVGGTYREVSPPNRLVFTWQWEKSFSPKNETLVTLTFTASGDGTELVLTHERFADRETRDDHDKGWNGCLDRLTQFVP